MRSPVAAFIPVLVWLLCLFFSAMPAAAFQLEETEAAEGYEGFEPVEVRDGALSWALFAAVGEVEREETDAEGFVFYRIDPAFTEEMRALDGKTVRLMGYMFPLQPNPEQHHFLMGPYPPDCAYHYHVNANQVVEVLAEKGISYAYDPVAVEGRLELLERDPHNIFYRLHNTKLKKTY